MPITPKERELAAVGVSVASGCKPCTNYHIKAVREAGASDDEIRQAVADALRVRASATSMMESHALSRLGEGEQPDSAVISGETSRVKELVSVGAAFGVNCVSNLKRHLAAAETVGISQEEVAEIVRLAAFIKERAASHVERLVGMREEDDPAKSLAAYKSMFGG
jgi:AhpD family alkylhydroperoxidase